MIHGGEELHRRLTELADAGAVKGWHAQLNYLTRSQRLRDISSQQFGTRNLVAWLRGPDTPGGRAPSPANQAEIRKLYQREHRRNMAETLKRKLGQGTRIEVHPDPDIVAQSNGRVTFQQTTIYEWDHIVDHWLANDISALEADWEDICDREFYPPRAYYYVAHLGF